ncbi:sulfatase family protein [Halocatena marina]|uniref:Sulfatase n=1 Tax=Halocatena marina TaxID=2934937 RepID=A0ABD5YXT7_9EURY|nr:sulfatase [Halocatena marina]
MADQPNVLVVLPDQHRGMATAPAGNTDVHTPTLERLAEEGAHCPNAYANVPVCTPNRGCFLTGQYPHDHGAVANDLSMRSDVETIGETFQDAGYNTAYVGKWHLDGIPRDKFTPPGPRRHGFDHWAVYNCHVDFFGGHYYRDTSEKEHFNDYEPIALTDMALEFLDEQRTDEDPFCLVVSPHPPHAPYEDVPQRYRDQYDPAEIDLRPNVDTDATGAPQDGGDLAEDLANYYANVTAVDEQVGRLLDWLDEADEADDTVVLYTSDHGDMIWSQGYHGKSQPYEESIHVPFFCRYPEKVPAGSTPEQIVSTVDVAPTLCSLAGVGELPDARGVDLASALQGDNQEGPSSAFIGLPKTVDISVVNDLPAWRGVRTEQYTYARRADGSPWLLYDNESDPYQQENLVDTETSADLVTQLDAEVDRWVEHTGDPDLSGEELLAELGLIEAWNQRERSRHPENPQLVE